MAVLSPSSAVLGLSDAGVMGRSLSSDGNNIFFGVTNGRRVGLGAIFPGYRERRSSTIYPQTK